MTNGREIVNGAVYVGAVPAQARVSYVGPNVQEDYLAADGSTVIRTLLGTSYTVVSLSGLISATPSELFTNSALLGNDIDAGKFLSQLQHDGRQDLSAFRWPDRHVARRSRMGGQQRARG
ncbi:hypothetical protein [Paraburkholderia sp. MM5482-R1]|uniref:hypothetical protein n=1 Tax=unclassified Paraburkholderia TaxID=2615204 RepID=UPI003D1D9A0E